MKGPGLDNNLNEELKRTVMKKVVKRKRDLFLNHHRSTTGKPMSFINYPYLMQIYKDISFETCIMSSVQTGKSEETLIHANACLEYGLSVFHVFSTSMAKNAFVKSRVEDLCDKVPYYQEMEKDVLRNHYLKTYGNARWKFAISTARNNFDEFPADVVIIDELDSCDQENVKLADGRMENSPYKFKRIIGNPTVKNRGISDLYDKSTMNEWYFGCRSCNELFISDFFVCVVNEITDGDGNHLRYELYDKEWHHGMGRDILIQCPHCGTLQNRNKWEKKHNKKAVYNGKWIEHNPDARVSGYHISQVMKLNTKLSDMWEKLQEAEGNDFQLQVFYNRLLGLPYEGVGSKISMELLKACSVGYSEFKAGQSHGKAVAGIDVGSYYDMQIDLPVRVKGSKQKRRLFLHACRCESLEEVKEKIQQYNVGTLYIDAAPEYNSIKEFQEDMYGKCEVWRVQISKGRSGALKMNGYKIDEDDGRITVDRDWLLEEGMIAVKTKVDLIPEHFNSICDGFWAESLCSVTREFNNDEGLYHWSKAEGKDHFRFAHAFSFLAFMDSREPVFIDDLGTIIGVTPPEDETKTPEQKLSETILKQKVKAKRSTLDMDAGVLIKRKGIRAIRDRRQRFGRR